MISASELVSRKASSDAQEAHLRSVALMKFLSRVSNKLGVGNHVYVVGGAVRNFVLGLPAKDLDIVVDSVAAGQGRDSEWFAKHIQSAIPTTANLTTNQYGVAILTVKGPWILDGQDMQGEVIEIANARKESYGGAEGKGFKPHMVEPARVEEDVDRREFTFNTLLWRMLDLAQGPDKAEIIDLTGRGLKDLKDGIMATPRDPDIVFSDDPTRLLRAVKFVAKYGFKIPPDLAASIKRNAPKMKNAPWEAIGKLLVENVLDEPTVRESLKMMKGLGLLDVIAEMIRENKPFQSYIAGQMRNRKVQVLLDLMDLGVTGFKTPLTFLSPSQVESLRLITVGMPSGEAEKFLAALTQPAVNNTDLIEEFTLEGKDRSLPQAIARTLMLSEPSLATNPAGLQKKVRDALAVTQIRGVPSPLKTAGTNAKIIEAPHNFHPVTVEEPKKVRKEFPFEGFIDFQGLLIDIENKKGSKREGVDPDGHPWSTEMFSHYGEIRGTEGSDGDLLDAYVGDNHDSGIVVVVHQHNPWDGQFDEDKVMLGYDSIEEAIGAYKKQYDKPGYFKADQITVLPMGQFWRWVKDDRNKGKRIKAASMSGTRYEFILVELSTPPGLRLYPVRKPDEVYRWKLRSKPPVGTVPDPLSNCQVETFGHDWQYRGGQLKYSGVGLDHDTWLILQYGDGTKKCISCDEKIPDVAKFCPMCGDSQISDKTAAKGVNLAPLYHSFLGDFAERDAIGYGKEVLTKDDMEEVAWELGYEGESYDRLFKKYEPLARNMGADIRGEFDKGAKEGLGKTAGIPGYHGTHTPGLTELIPGGEIPAMVQQKKNDFFSKALTKAFKPWSLDFLGVWVTSSRDHATMYGKTVYEVEIPEGKYREGRLPFQETFFDYHLAREFLSNKVQKWLDSGWSDKAPRGSDPQVPRIFERYLKGIVGLNIPRMLDQVSVTDAAFIQLAMKEVEEIYVHSKAYLLAWKEQQKAGGFDGVVWRNSKLDVGSEGATHDAYLIWSHLPVKAEETLGDDEAAVMRQRIRNVLALHQEAAVAVPGVWSGYDFTTAKGILKMDEGIRGRCDAVLEADGTVTIVDRFGKVQSRGHQRAASQRVKTSSAKDGVLTGDGTGVGLFIPVPEKLATQFPSLGLEDKSIPHVTFLYVGEVPSERQDEFLKIVSEELAHMPPVEAAFMGTDSFDNGDSRTVYSPVRFSSDMSKLHDSLKGKLILAGFEVSHTFPLYTPHATLAYLKDPRGVWEGTPPVGSWIFKEVEVWGLPKLHKIPLLSQTVSESHTRMARVLSKRDMTANLVARSKR